MGRERSLMVNLNTTHNKSLKYKCDTDEKINKTDREGNGETEKQKHELFISKQPPTINSSFFTSISCNLILPSSLCMKKTSKTAYSRSFVTPIMLCYQSSTQTSRHTLYLRTLHVTLQHFKCAPTLHLELCIKVDK